MVVRSHEVLGSAVGTASPLTTEASPAPEIEAGRVGLDPDSSPGTSQELLQVELEAPIPGIRASI